MRALGDAKYNILTGRAPDLRERASELAGELLRKILLPLIERAPRLADGGAGEKILYGVFILIGVVFVALTAHLIAARVKSKKARAVRGEYIYETAPVITETAEGLLRKAARSAGDGCYREAVRYGYLALLLAFDRSGAIRLLDSKTNGQLKKELRSSAPGMHGDFESVAGVFDAARFGHAEIGPEKYEHNLGLTLSMIKKCRAGAPE